MSRRDRDDDNTPAARAHDGGADDGVGRIVAALDDDVGLKRFDERERGVFVENDDGVHELERGEYIGALVLRAHGALGALVEATHRGVAIEADDEPMPFGARAAEHINVPRMQ